MRPGQSQESDWVGTSERKVVAGEAGMEGGDGRRCENSDGGVADEERRRSRAWRRGSLRKLEVIGLVLSDEEG